MIESTELTWAYGSFTNVLKKKYPLSETHFYFYRHVLIAINKTLGGNLKLRLINDQSVI